MITKTDRACESRIKTVRALHKAIAHKLCMTCSVKLRLVNGTDVPQECYDCGSKRLEHELSVEWRKAKPPKERGLFNT